MGSLNVFYCNFLHVHVCNGVRTQVLTTFERLFAQDPLKVLGTSNFHIQISLKILSFKQAFSDPEVIKLFFHAQLN